MDSSSEHVNQPTKTEEEEEVASAAARSSGKTKPKSSGRSKSESHLCSPPKTPSKKNSVSSSSFKISYTVNTVPHLKKKSKKIWKFGARLNKRYFVFGLSVKVLIFNKIQNLLTKIFKFSMIFLSCCPLCDKMLNFNAPFFYGSVRKAKREKNGFFNF